MTRRPPLMLVLVLAAASVLGAASAAPGQTTPATRPEAAAPLAPPAVAAPVPRPPVLREGSQLVRVVGRLSRTDPRSPWVFRVDAADAQTPGHELIMLPCSLLGEMERMVETSEDHALVFETTGQVFVHRGRNYLLLTQPPLLVGHEPRTAGAPFDTSGADGSSGGDSAGDIIRDLERAVGPVARRPAAAPAPANALDDTLLREGTVIIARRGRVRRSAGGAFTFVFDADAEGLADPPMTLAPCLLLERLEATSREAPPILLSGRVFTYRGQNYLLPTVFRLPRERTVIDP